MRTARNFLTQDEQKQVEEAIHTAEKRTSAEIVCAVATESGRYDRAEAIVGLFTGILFLLLLNLAAPFVGQQIAPSGDWNTPAITLAFVDQAIAILLGFVLGNVVASYWHGLRRCFVWTSQIEQEVARSAAYVFAIRRLTSTRDTGGLLLYVSLFEHRAVVLADAGLMEKLGQPFLDRLRDVAVTQLKARQPLATLLDTIAVAADELAAALPAKSDDSDELPNALVLIHPRP